MKKEQIGKMDFSACKSCKNQAGPRGCNSGSCFEESISVDEEDGIITCNYYVIADQIVGDDFKGPGGHVSSPDCYCKPVLDFVDEETGSEVWVHNDLQGNRVHVHNNKVQNKEIIENLTQENMLLQEKCESLSRGCDALFTDIGRFRKDSERYVKLKKLLNGEKGKELYDYRIKTGKSLDEALDDWGLF